MDRITSRRSPIAMHIKKLGSSRSYRDGSGEFLCDGIKLLEDAVMSGAEITTVLTSSPLPLPLPVDTKVYFTERSLIDSLSPLKNAQEILFLCRFPSIGVLSAQEIRDIIKKRGTVILLDGLQDPGNVGAIIRTANALGIASVLLAGECADPYNPKAVRASMGAIFRQSVGFIKYPELISLHESGVRFIASMPGSDRDSISNADLNGTIVAIGNEGGGLSNEALTLCDEKITIPISPGSESLNAAAAAAIIIWEAYRRRNTDS